jgi:hypothetical protein
MDSTTPTVAAEGHNLSGSFASTPIDDLPQFLTPHQIQTYLQVGRSSAYELARKHGVKVGRLVRVPKEVLLALRRCRNNT